MNKKILIIALLISCAAKASNRSDVMALAKKNHLQPSKEVISAILSASKWYGLNPLDLAVIGILETGLGKYNSINKNKNGTFDSGIFQINTINKPKCINFDLNTIEGNTYCAAKLLHQIKTRHQINDFQWLARYHSKTKSFKRIYYKKITKVLAMNSDKYIVR